MQEIISKCFYFSYFSGNKKIITARAGNVLGGADWAKDRLITDIITAIKHKNFMKVRYPHNTRPWQYVCDLIYGYLLTVYIVSRDVHNFYAFNFSPKNPIQ